MSIIFHLNFHILQENLLLLLRFGFLPFCEQNHFKSRASCIVTSHEILIRILTSLQSVKFCFLCNDWEMSIFIMRFYFIFRDIHYVIHMIVLDIT